MIIFAGMVMTFQRGDQGQYGTSYKVAPMTTYTVKNKVSCFKVPGFAEAPVAYQPLLPDLSGFEVGLHIIDKFGIRHIHHIPVRTTVNILEFGVLDLIKM